MAPWDRKKQVEHNDIAFWNISLNTEMLPKYFMKYFTGKKYCILYISRHNIVPFQWLGRAIDME